MARIHRRRILLGASALAFASAARSQPSTWPNRPVRILVGYSAGGAVDIVARSIAQHLQADLGQPVIVENRPGAGTNIATRALVDSAPDGYTLMVAANALAANVSLFRPAPYEIDRVAPIAGIGRVPIVLAANAKSSIANVGAFFAKAKGAPGTISFGTPGNGSTPHLAMELLQRAAGVQLLHVPYKGGAQAITDAIGGQIEAVAVNALELEPHVKAGTLRVLAVLSEKRSPIFPTAPTIAESGFAGFEASVWYGLVAPAGTPTAVIATLQDAVQKALAAPDVRERLSQARGEVAPGSTQAFAQLLAREQQRYARLIREAGIKPD